MGELRGQPCLAPEPADGALVAGHVRMQELERDLATEREVAHSPHGAERARSEGRNHFVVLGESPAEAHFGRLARRRGVIATQCEHRATAEYAVHRADHRRHGRESLLRVFLQRAVEHGGHRGRHVGTDERDRRDIRRRRRLTRERVKTEGTELPLVGRWAGRPPVAPVGRRGHGRHVRREVVRNGRERDGPLPPDEPQAAHRRGEHVEDRKRAVHASRVVQIGERGADLAHHAHHSRDVLHAGAGEACAHRLAGNPPSQIARPTLTLLVDRPVVIRGRDRGVVAVGVRARLGLEPRSVLLERRAYQRERAAKGVDELLEVSVVFPHPFGAPAPAGRKLPLGQMLRKGRGEAVEATPAA